jgi:hypothetical protein
MVKTWVLEAMRRVEKYNSLEGRMLEEEEVLPQSSQRAQREEGREI